MKKFLYAVILVIFCLFFSGVLAYAEFDEGTVIAVVKPQADDFISLSSLSAPFGELEIEESQNLAVTSGEGISLFSLGYEEQVYKVTLADKGYDEVLEAVEYLNSLDNIEYAEPNYIYSIFSTPNDPSYSSQSFLGKVSAPSVWDLGIDSSGVTVAVVDSGAYMEHPDLAANFWSNPDSSDTTVVKNYLNQDYTITGDVNGWNFLSNSNDPSDDHGHGTHVSGIVSAVTNNNLGIASLAGNAKVVPLKVMDSSGNGTTAEVILAVNYARKKGFDIVNMSFGGPNESSALVSAIKKTDALFVCAAGNGDSTGKGLDNDSIPVYPASSDCDNIIAVAATTNSDSLASFSNYGATSVDIAAPGYYIYSTWIVGTTYKYYKNDSGTSMACPLVASAAAVVKAQYNSKNVDITPVEIKEKLMSSVDSVSALNGKVVSNGRLNAYEAVLIHAESVELSENSLSLMTGDTASLTASALPSYTTDEAVWESSNEAVVRVSDGVVSAVGAGNAVITVTYGSVSDTCSVTVTAPSPTPTIEPTPEPTPTTEPTAIPTAEPTSEPTAEPTVEPTTEPTTKPTVEPISEPTAEPTVEPTAEPTVEPTIEPTAIPTVAPTPEPTPTIEPTAIPTVEPTAEPTAIPTVEPTAEPTATPTSRPHSTPKPKPTATPEPTPEPTPTIEPTVEPTIEPTAEPTAEPTVEPTTEPTVTPTVAPTPTIEPTAIPTIEPTVEPTAEPTVEPTTEPTVTPTVAPTPTVEPTAIPTIEPTALPTIEPTPEPTSAIEPAIEPTSEPTSEPMDRVEFTEKTDGSIDARLIFEATSPLDFDKTRVYIAYREKDTDTLVRVDMITVDEAMEFSFRIPDEIPDACVTIYIWDDSMKPVMTPQSFDP